MQSGCPRCTPNRRLLLDELPMAKNASRTKLCPSRLRKRTMTSMYFPQSTRSSSFACGLGLLGRNSVEVIGRTKVIGRTTGIVHAFNPLFIASSTRFVPPKIWRSGHDPGRLRPAVRDRAVERNARARSCSPNHPPPKLGGREEASSVVEAKRG